MDLHGNESYNLRLLIWPTLFDGTEASDSFALFVIDTIKLAQMDNLLRESRIDNVSKIAINDKVKIALIEQESGSLGSLRSKRHFVFVG